MSNHTDEALARLAEKVVHVFVAGDQSPVTVAAHEGNSWKVRVADGEVEWRGPLNKWRAALAAAANT